MLTVPPLLHATSVTAKNTQELLYNR
jgi:hypothetical protein